MAAEEEVGVLQGDTLADQERNSDGDGIGGSDFFRTSPVSFFPFMVTNGKESDSRGLAPRTARATFTLFSQVFMGPAGASINVS